VISRAADTALDVDKATATAPPIVWPIAVDAAAAAAMFHLSVRAWWSLHSSGRCPLPIRCGRSVRWRLDELRQWAEQGCPSRDAMRAMQSRSDRP
jgi:predicted DNA-binding transcriptional regulator AlpA